MLFEDFFDEWYDSTRDYIVAHTSGSTGTPKEIRLAKSDMAVSARRTNAFFGIDCHSTLVCPLSLDYIAGKMMAVRAILSGAMLVQIPPSNDFTMSWNLQADLIAIVPSQVDALLKIVRTRRVFNAIIGGAPLDDARRKALKSAGVNAYETYGMTETASHVALRHINAEDFRGLDGFTFSTDQRSCLVIESADMTFRRLVTNDIVEMTGANTFRWLGRADNVINSGGIKIVIEQLEAEIAAIFPDLQFYVGRQPDDKWGEVPVMYVKGVGDTDAIARELASRLDHRRLPRSVIAVAEFPLTANGKIKRQ